MNPPRAVIEKNELLLRFESPADQPQAVRPLVDRILGEIEQHLGWQRPMITAHNAALPDVPGRSDSAEAEPPASAITTSGGTWNPDSSARRRAYDLLCADGATQGRRRPCRLPRRYSSSRNRRW